jgi:hypothetical protein
VDSYPGPLFYSSGPHVYFCASTLAIFIVIAL